MKTKFKLLALVIVALIVLSAIALLMSQKNDNTKSQSNIIRVACVGDSITEGFDYPNDLWMLLGSNYSVGNFGVGGAAVELNSGKPYMNQSEFQKAKEFAPNIVIIMLGTNDANPALKQNTTKFVEDYAKLIGAFQELPSKPKIWIVKPPPVFNNGTGLSTETFAKYVISSIEQVANFTNLPLIDVYTPMLEHSDYFFDGVHPNGEGAQAIANIIYNGLISQTNSTSTPSNLPMLHFVIFEFSKADRRNIYKNFSL